MPGVVALQTNSFSTYETAAKEIEMLNAQLKNNVDDLNGFPFIILTEDSDFISEKLNNYLWVTYTRCNPSHDIYGIGEFIVNKHWGCKGPLVIDARKKPHHAPPVEKVPAVEARIDKFFAQGGILYKKGI